MMGRDRAYMLRYVPHEIHVSCIVLLLLWSVLCTLQVHYDVIEVAFLWLGCRRKQNLQIDFAYQRCCRIGTNFESRFTPSNTYNVKKK